MLFENQGMTLWYGTSDAPAPEGDVQAGAEVSITVGIKPTDITNKVEVSYRVGQGTTEIIAANWLRHDVSRQAQYFIARFPAFPSGDTVEYRVVGRCAGKQVPSQEDSDQFPGNFKVVGSDTQLASTLNPQASTQPVKNASTNATEELKVANVPEAVTPTPTPSPATVSSPANPSLPTLLESRINTINSVLDNANHQAIVSEAIKASNGKTDVALSSLSNQLPSATLQKVTLANSLADLTSDNVAVVKTLTSQSNITSLRDIALSFNVEKLAAVVDPKTLPDTITGATDAEKTKNFAVSFQHQLFAMEPSAVLQRMVQVAEIPIADSTVRAGVITFLANQPEFNIRTTSVYTALKSSEVFKNIPVEQQAAVVDQVKILQRVQAISPIPEAVPVLIKANLTSAFHVAEMPESAFLSAYSPAIGEEPARQVYTAAINSRIRNEHALMTMRESVRGTGLDIIDGQRSREDRLVSLQQVAEQQGAPINLSTLFGSLDYCECDDCQSIYSPAAYFVELLQYLRNNNLDSNPANPNSGNTGKSGITGTPLEKLFYRRPDLGCLELTCQNAFTVLPYVDLVNEVMESFIIHQSDYNNSNTDPNQRQAKLDVFNVEDETTNELLAQPQHINYDAYCILKNAVYPFTLPYHQPIDAIRIFLKYLGTSCSELLDTYRTATITCSNLTLSPAQQQELQTWHEITLDRAVDAERLGLTQEEYIILTKEAFWSIEYFEITLQQPNLTLKEYQQQIGVRDVWKYYGYQAEADMCNTDETKCPNATNCLGLTFVKWQFLPRTGIVYTDLVELLKTRFINPNYPHGQALALLDSIRFSYRFLQTLVDTSSSDPQIKYAKLIAFLDIAQPFVPILNALLHPDPCNQQRLSEAIQIQDWHNWVYCYFERIGQLIVLDAGEGPQLPIEGTLFACQQSPTPKIAIKGNVNSLQVFNRECNLEEVGILNKDGKIFDPTGQKIIGNVTLNGMVLDTKGQPLVKTFGVMGVGDGSGNFVGFIYQDGFLYIGEERIVTWLPPRDTCNLDKVRLIHLDGSPLIPDEYDRIHRFIRLWRKLGWTIDETDKALSGLSANLASANNGSILIECDFVSFQDFSEDCSYSENNGNTNCPDIATVDYDITPDFLHQLVAVLKLLDQTGLPLIKLLTFWADISTDGAQSLYAKLFLTYNLVSIDRVLQADSNGNYLTQSAKITDHLPVLMVALNLKADDINAIAKFRNLPDALTLPNLSILYRHSLLTKILHIRVTDLQQVIALFGDPFQSAVQTLSLLENWGKMEDAGFTFRQLDYIIRDYDYSLKPLAPSLLKILQLTKTLYDGLNAIDLDNPDIKSQDDATSDIIKSKAGLLFDQSVVGQIISFLEGTMVYTMNVTTIIDSKNIPPLLAQKFKYVSPKAATSSGPPPCPPPSATVQITGILTDDEQKQAKALSNDLDWGKDIDCLNKQALNFFNDTLFGIFPNPNNPETANAIKTLLMGDVNVPADPNNSDATKDNTAPQKRCYFLKYFMPFLRQQLEHRLIVQTLAGATSLPNDVTDVLLSDILKTGTPTKYAITALDNIKAQPLDPANDWKGYLIPPADNSYTFIATSEMQPNPIVLEGQSIPFLYQQDCPPGVWSSDPVQLKHGRLYFLEVQRQAQPTTCQSTPWLNWKTPTSPKALIPSSALLPDYSSQSTKEVFTKLYKVAILVNGFNLSADEISYLQIHGSDFADSNQAALDFNNITLGHWQRLQAYTSLRDSVPRVNMTFLDLFSWVTNPNPDPSNKPNIKQLSSKIAAITNWNQTNIDILIQPDHFNLCDLADFSNEINLIKLQKALQVADKVAVDINRLFDWAKPGSKFWACHQIAEDIRKAIRARYTEDDWEQVVKPLNDQLRENQKQALISYLLVQKPIIDWIDLGGDEVDADSLFDFFLIDVQMGSCMKTSRIKQALSSVQLFIQRCFLGLEELYGVKNDVLDRDRWEWMKLYRVWEANREVFCYPENWIDPQLRDDKSQFYTELESELLQKDINTQTIQDALQNYLFKVDEVANMKVVGLFVEEDDHGNPLKIHIFSRTRNTPYFFYYRYYDVSALCWHPWEKVQVDIPSYDVLGDKKQILENGAFLIPVVWNKRLLIFFPQVTKKTASNSSNNHKTFQELGTTTLDSNQPVEYWEIKMAWSEYRNGNWTKKQVSNISVVDSSDPLPPVNLYQFVPKFGTSNSKIAIDIYRIFPPHWIYFQGMDCYLYRILEDGSQQTRIGSQQIASSPFVTADGWVYFQGLRDNGLYKIFNDGTQAQNIGGNFTGSSPFVTADGWVYFQAVDAPKSLCKVFNDGTQGQQIGDPTPNATGSSPFVTADGWVYFQAVDAPKSLCKVFKNGKHGQIIGDKPTASTPFVTEDGWVYFQGTDNNLYKVFNDGTPPAQRLGSQQIASSPFVTEDGWVYFQGLKDNGLYKIFNDGSQGQIIGDKPTASTPFVTEDGWVYFQGTDNNLYKVFNDGTQLAQRLGSQQIKSAPFVEGLLTTWPYDEGVIRNMASFVFSGSQITSQPPTYKPMPGYNFWDTDFQYFQYFPNTNQLHSFQINDNLVPPLLNTEPYFVEQDGSVLYYGYGTSAFGTPAFIFAHSFIHELLSQLTTGNLDDLFNYYLTIDPAHKVDAYGGYLDKDGKTFLYNELRLPYSLYNWEPGFHAPMELVDRLLNSQQFEQALKICQYVFNPLAAGTDDKRFWQFPPFKDVNAENVLEDLFLSLQPGQSNGEINAWRDNPFQPHVVARSRPSAYMKYVVMKYIEILIAWGDYLFRQDTIETINQATQLYVLASHIYGPRGQKIPKRGKVQPQTYNSLRDKWDAFGNAMVEMELAFPFSNQTPFPVGISNGVVGLANVFGFATTLYFCIPDNPQLIALRDTIDDRLFKIRHCQNIEGVFQQLPLFDPPIDPGLLVQAAAQGLSLSSVLNDLNSPLPNYRFYYLLQKALELCTELKALGNAFLSAQEKGDGEALSRLRAKHESSIQNLVMAVKKQQLDEANSSLDALNQNRLGPVSRMQYYLQLIGQDINKIPDASTDFSDLPNQIEQPSNDSGLVLIGSEKEEMDKANDAANWHIAIGGAETLASILHLIPAVSAKGEPLGVGIGVTFGGWNLGNAAQAIANGMKIYGDYLSFQSTNAGRKASFLRQLQDRVQQANNAGYEIKNIDKQILTQQIRINITNQEITNQQQQIDNAQEVEDFLRNKYTNQELYIWMGDQLRGLYYQAYTLAYDLAKKAEKVYRFERGLTTSNFIQFGYWNAAYDGLLAGEQLYIGLKQLETAYQEKRGYDFEITKQISLRQVNPIALLQLRETGQCDFALPEVVFDMDRPGDYMRRIKSVAITIPCVVGPYTSLNCTLRLLEHKFRMNAITAKADYPERTDGTEDRFMTFNIPITAIAVSTGQNDSGVFELNFKDERYLPFEGAGAISKWRLELPNAFRQFDHNTITDVILTLRYTAVDGGDKLKSTATAVVKDYINSMVDLSQQNGLFATFDLKHDFSSEWYKAMNLPTGSTDRVLMLDNLQDRLPIFTKMFKIQATDLYLFTTAAETTLCFELNGTGSGSGPPTGTTTIQSFNVHDDNGFAVNNKWQLTIKGMNTEPDQFWLVIGYGLKKGQ